MVVYSARAASAFENTFGIQEISSAAETDDEKYSKKKMADAEK